jgi:hypothetical protein
LKLFLFIPKERSMSQRSRSSSPKPKKPDTEKPALRTLKARDQNEMSKLYWNREWFITLVGEEFDKTLVIKSKDSDVKELNLLMDLHESREDIGVIANSLEECDDTYKAVFTAWFEKYAASDPAGEILTSQGGIGLDKPRKPYLSDERVVFFEIFQFS